MNREEALREMRDGAKVRHQYFTSEEYLFMDRYDRIMTEDGYEFAGSSSRTTSLKPAGQW